MRPGDAARIVSAVRRLTAPAARLAAVLALALASGGCRCVETPPEARHGPMGRDGGQAAQGASPLREPSAPGSAARAPAAREASGLRAIERVTGGAGADAELPLVVAIHGLGDSPEGLARLFDGFDAPARIVLPQGPAPWGDGYRWMPWGGDEERAAREAEESAERLVALIAEVSRQRPTRGRAIVTGFSQGGIMAFTLAALHPEALAYALPISGQLLQPSWDAARGEGRLPVVRALHGTDDEVLDPNPSRQSVVRLRSLGFDATIRLYEGVGHAIPRQVRRDLFALLQAMVAAEAGGGASLPVEPEVSCPPCPGPTVAPGSCTLCPAG